MNSSDEVSSTAHRVTLGVGCNCGDRHSAMTLAMEWLCTLLTGARCSAIYETEPVGGGTRNYLNAVVTGETLLSDTELNTLLKEYEYAHGRDAEARRRGDVWIDIDLVMSADNLLRPFDFSQDFFLQGYSELTLPKLP
ncbi:MAG: 2-amino-4-hydroxy-6-hydroxymethyldihydropteridine diphosphokinase [Muribaculaceae bacterium]|nr:2-amino-4-hydroxy-6-hydroxymethyldihydropteridine diphosphokinase [Muribaculaceae bacterium]